MDICYFNSQVKEELDGASDYICRAIDCKKSHPTHASLYAKMSEAELGHAANLISIFEDCYKEETKDLNPIPPIYSGFHKTLLEMYTKCVASIKEMHQTYQSL